MDIKIIKEPISLEELKQFLHTHFENLVKAVVDIEQGIMAIGGELHADEEVVLTEREGSKREYTWGINIYPNKNREEWIEFDSMINLKPMHGNMSRGVDNLEIQEKIKQIVDRLILV